MTNELFVELSAEPAEFDDSVTVKFGLLDSTQTYVSFCVALPNSAEENSNEGNPHEAHKLLRDRLRKIADAVDRHIQRDSQKTP